VTSRSDETTASGAPRSEFQRSVDRLERAVEGLVGAANDQIGSRAAGFIDDTAQRLERELEQRNRSRAARGDGDSVRRDERRQARRERHRARRERVRERSISSSSPDYRTKRLYLDRRHRKISGVCAGIARYFGVEIWVVRCIAVTGLIFMASIVVPAYIIAAIVLPNGPPDTAGEAQRGEADHSSPAPELGTRLSPRGSLRTVAADLDQLELKLRRMESHVTSGQFELQRELRRIDV
jgi:phage shock protein C